jgi:hypothetical protein
MDRTFFVMTGRLIELLDVLIAPTPALGQLLENRQTVRSQEMGALTSKSTRNNRVHKVINRCAESGTESMF